MSDPCTRVEIVIHEDYTGVIQAREPSLGEHAEGQT